MVSPNMREVSWWVVGDDQSGWPVSWRNCVKRRIKSFARCDVIEH